MTHSSSHTMYPPWTFIQRLRSCLLDASGEGFNLGSAAGRGHHKHGRNGMGQWTQIQRNNVLGFEGFQALHDHLGKGFCRGRCDCVHASFRRLKGTTFGRLREGQATWLVPRNAKPPCSGNTIINPLPPAPTASPWIGCDTTCPKVRCCSRQTTKQKDVANATEGGAQRRAEMCA